MKKFIAMFLILILSMLLLSACDNNKNNNQNNNNNNGGNTSLSIEDYFPNTDNTKYDYEGQGNEYAYYTVYTDYSKDNRVQTRTNNGGTEVVKVLENKDGQLVEIFSRPETYFRENFTDNEYEGGNIILKEPIQKENSWTLTDGSKRTITNTDVEITTPMGTYKTLEVTTEANDYKNVDYYAKDIGLIKTVSTGEGYEVSSTLRTIEKDVPLIQNVNVYFPSLEDDTYYYITKEIYFKTNDEAKDVIEKMVKNNEEQATVVSTNAKLNSLYLNEEENMVYVDFSKEFVSEMNAGSGFEGMILQSITNTLGNYYGVDKVYITVDNKPYESGHIIMNEKEPFKVNLEKTKPLK